MYPGIIDPTWYEYLGGITNPSTAPNAVDWNPNTGVFLPSPAPVTINGSIINPIPDPSGSGKGIVPYNTLPYGYDIVPPSTDFPSGIAARVGINIPDPRTGIPTDTDKPFDLTTLLIILMLAEDK